MVGPPSNLFFFNFFISISSFLIKRKLKGNFVFLRFLTAKIDGEVQSDRKLKVQGSKVRGFEVQEGHVKRGSSSGVQSEFFFF